MNKEKPKDKTLKMTAIIVSGFLGFVTILGIFWGTTGIRNTGIGLGILVALVGFIGFNSAGGINNV